MNDPGQQSEALGTFLGTCLFAPVTIMLERLERWRRLSPIEQNLQRTSHGVAYIFFAMLGAYRVGPSTILGTLPLVFGNDPFAAWPGAVFVAAVGYGLGRFFFGVRRSKGIRDGILAMRGLVKLITGSCIVWYMWRTFPRAITGTSLYDDFLQAIVAGGLWMAITGAVRLVLMTGFGGGSAYGAVASHISATNFQWPAPQQQRRRWWQGWRGLKFW